MGMIFKITRQGKVYACKHCQTHLALAKDLISEAFWCSHGIAYLVENVDNVWTGEPETRKMTSGYHTVVDIFCVGCGDLMGWRYESVMNEENNYKIGRFILMRYTLKFYICVTCSESWFLTVVVVQLQNPICRNKNNHKHP
ncbi:hypothetical protein QQ045_023626 [Rhodiola kirilowii]